MNRLLARRHSDLGASAVEFALVFAFVLVPLLMGMMQYGWYFFTAQSASSAARETARRLVVGDCQSSGAAKAYAVNQANVISLNLTFGTPADDDSDVLPDVGSVLRVKATADGNIVGFFPMPNGGLVTRIVDARVEDDAETAPCP